MNARQPAVGVAQLARSRCAFLLGFIVVTSAAAEPRWWMDEPVRLLQRNLRETDSTLDAQRLVRQVAEFPANALLFNMGGIVAHYPTRVDFHYPSPHLPPGRDLFGDVLQAAHRRGIRVIGRFDLSKTQKPVFDAHPLVEITVMRQPTRNRTLVHFVNVSGHADTAYFAPIEMLDISVELDAPFRRATAVDLNKRLRVAVSGPYHRFTLPRLNDYAVVVLEE